MVVLVEEMVVLVEIIHKVDILEGQVVVVVVEAPPEMQDH